MQLFPVTQGKRVPDVRIAKIAAKQHGVFVLAQAIAVGFSEKAIRVRLATGRWIRVHRGVYAIAGAPRTEEQRVLAAVMSLGPQAVAASVTAAWALGFLERPSELVYVLLPDGQHRSGRKRIVVGEARLTKTDVRTANGIRVTGPERTIIDAAGVLTEMALEELLDDSIQVGLTTVPKLRRYIHERRLGHRPGAKVLRELLDDRTKGVPQKKLEKTFLRNLRAAGLPEPDRQMPCGTYFIDFAYPERSVAIELDGRATHFSGRAFRQDPRRRNQLVLAGWVPYLFTWDDITELWDETEAVLRAALGLPESS